MSSAFLTSISLGSNRISFTVPDHVRPTSRIASSAPWIAKSTRVSVRAVSILPIISFFFSPTPPITTHAVHAMELPAQVAPSVVRRNAYNNYNKSHGAIAIVSPSGAMIEKLRVNVNDRLSFWFSEFLMWHPSARVIALLGMTLLFMYLGSFLYRLADPQKREAAHPFWHSVRAIANPLEDDWENNYLRATSITLAAIGMVFFAILVGMVTESVESAVHAVDGAGSSVIVKDHILVCGWDSHVSQILKDVSSLSKETPIVVLAKPEKRPVMFSQLREALPDDELRKLRLFYRPGVPVIKDDLSRVAATRAKKIILVTERQGDPTDADRQTLSRAMALRQNLPGFTGDIVAELRSERDERILKAILRNTQARSVETINAEKLLYRFMAQAIRQPGLADVVGELMGDDVIRVFHVEAAQRIAPDLVGSKLNTLKPTSIPGSILCGFVMNGTVKIGLGSELSIQPSTELLFLGGQRNTGTKGIEASDIEGTIIKPGGIQMAERKKEPESYLICGWRPEMRHMLKELDEILVRGSKLTILAEDAPMKPPRKLKNLSLKTVHNRADRYENLEELFLQNPKGFDHVVILSSTFGGNELKETGGTEEDAATIASLAYVNELLHNQREAQQIDAKTVVTVEFLNERIAQMAKEQGYVANSILPHNLSAKIAAQTVRDSRLNTVWNQLLSQEGYEVYLRPCGAYEGVEESSKSFSQVAEDVCGYDDILLGYIGSDGRVAMNPSESNRTAPREWNASDLLIVLSEK